MEQRLSDGSWIVCGYVPSDAKKSSEKAPWKFSVKVGEKPKQEGQERPEAKWYSCASWRNGAGSVRKGDIVLAIGKLESNVGTDGKTYHTLMCDFVSRGVSDNAIVAQASPAVASASDFDGFEEVADGDGKLPF